MQIFEARGVNLPELQRIINHIKLISMVLRNSAQIIGIRNPQGMIRLIDLPYLLFITAVVSKDSELKALLGNSGMNGYESKKLGIVLRNYSIMSTSIATMPLIQGFDAQGFSAVMPNFSELKKKIWKSEEVKFPDQVLPHIFAVAVEGTSFNTTKLHWLAYVIDFLEHFSQDELRGEAERREPELREVIRKYLSIIRDVRDSEE